MVKEKIGSLHEICIIEYEIYIQLGERTSLHDKSADISKHAGWNNLDGFFLADIAAAVAGVESKFQAISSITWI